MGRWARVFELACGAGHFLREFGRFGEAAGGRRGVLQAMAGAAVCGAGELGWCVSTRRRAWPFADGAFDTVFCHDAFYFLPEKPHVAAEMRRVAPRVLVGHAHNALGG